MMPIISNVMVLNGEHPLKDGVPVALFVAFEKRVQNNHHQSVAQLRDRGGISPSEAVAILEDRKWKPMKTIDAMNRLIGHLGEFNKQPTTARGKNVS